MFFYTLRTEVGFPSTECNLLPNETTERYVLHRNRAENLRYHFFGRTTYVKEIWYVLFFSRIFCSEISFTLGSPP